jgi:hypothetical protein
MSNFMVVLKLERILKLLTFQKYPIIFLFKNLYNFSHFSYLQPAMSGEKVRAEVECLKIGRNIIFTEVTFRKANGSIVAKGKHTLSRLNHLKTNGEFVRQ